MRYEVTHNTRFSYESPVSRCLNEVRLTPRPLPSQRVHQSTIQVEPAPDFQRYRKDYFGNDVSTYGVIDVHHKLIISARSLVEVDLKKDEIEGSQPSWPSWPSWEDARDSIAAAADEPCLEASEFLYHSPYVPSVTDLETYARDTFKPGRPLVEAAKELNHRIFTEFKYDPKATSIDIPLDDVLRKRRGVCQDFAHVMVGALRSLRLAARYVSGYVRSGSKFQGAQASHAWVSVFVPGAGWVNFDPTNDVMPSDSHVTLAWGRDYGDVTPVKGVTLGGGGQTIAVEVYVKAL